ncbi:glycogen debranching N-terminal domain-containing protein, partial [Streptomyces sp. NPDC059900]
MTASDRVLLVRDGTFVSLGSDGAINGSAGASPDGLFLRDARHLSRWQLTVDGTAPAVLAGASEGPRATCVLTPAGTRDEPPAYTVFREQAVDAGVFTERLRIVSNRPEAMTARLALRVDADFADQFELRSDHRTYPKPDAARTVDMTPRGVEFAYRRGDWHSRTSVVATPAPDEAAAETDSTECRLVWSVELAAHGQAEVNLRVEAHPSGAVPRPLPTAATDDRPDLPYAEGDLLRACTQGLADLDLLRIQAGGPDGEPVSVPA